MKHFEGDGKNYDMAHSIPYWLQFMYGLRLLLLQFIFVCNGVI
jgi:hypothetical protein